MPEVNLLIFWKLFCYHHLYFPLAEHFKLLCSEERPAPLPGVIVSTNTKSCQHRKCSFFFKKVNLTLLKTEPGRQFFSEPGTPDICRDVFLWYHVYGNALPCASATTGSLHRSQKNSHLSTALLFPPFTPLWPNHFAHHEISLVFNKVTVYWLF